MSKHICGEHGPEFVGYGEPTEPSLWQRWGGTTTIALGLALGSLAVTALL